MMYVYLFFGARKKWCGTYGFSPVTELATMNCRDQARAGWLESQNQPSMNGTRYVALAAFIRRTGRVSPPTGGWNFWFCTHHRHAILHAHLPGAMTGAVCDGRRVFEGWGIPSSYGHFKHYFHREHDRLTLTNQWIWTDIDSNMINIAWHCWKTPDLGPLWVIRFRPRSRNAWTM
jgi:hypothetical protein